MSIAGAKLGCRDPDDEKLLETALTGEADCLITGDRDLLEMSPFHDIPILKCLGAQLAISVHNCPLLTDSRFPMSIFKRTQRKYVKKAYRVRNWREYEASLRNRGSLTVWISLTAGKLVNWDAPRCCLSL